MIACEKKLFLFLIVSHTSLCSLATRGGKLQSLCSQCDGSAVSFLPVSAGIQVLDYGYKSSAACSMSGLIKDSNRTDWKRLGDCYIEPAQQLMWQVEVHYLLALCDDGVSQCGFPSSGPERERSQKSDGLSSNKVRLGW